MRAVLAREHLRAVLAQAGAVAVPAALEHGLLITVIAPLVDAPDVDLAKLVTVHFFDR